MSIQLWYCSEMKKWRWTLTDATDSSIQESGQREDLRQAMIDVANTVDYLRNK